MSDHHYNVLLWGCVNESCAVSPNSTLPPQTTNTHCHYTPTQLTFNNALFVEECNSFGRECATIINLLNDYTHTTSSSCMSNGQCSHSHAHTEGATHGELNRDAYVRYNVFTTPSNIVRLCIYASSRAHTQLFNDVSVQIWSLKY